MAFDTRMETRTRESGWVMVLAGLLGGLLAVRLLALTFNGTDLFFDEAQYWAWSTEPAFGYYSKPPLIAWLIHGATLACGLAEPCIRLPSPLVHTATAAVVFLVGRQLYDARAGFWSALAYATLPGVSLSAGIISTDVPLLFFWAVALYAFIALIDTRRWWPALLLGAAFGLGLNAKYAMAYFVLCAAVYLAATPEHRSLLRDARLWVAVALGLALIAPNLMWNAGNSFATFSHTADNAKWTGSLMNPGKALEFLGAQFGVFGPILFGALIAVTVRAWRNGLPKPDRLLLAFAVPVLVVVTGQAFLSRAHANWAAVSYVSAAVLVTQTMIRDSNWRWLKASLGLHIAILVALALATAFAGSFRLPGAGDPFSRTLGWRHVATAAESALRQARESGMPFGAVIADERDVTAELLYYMRHEPTPVFAWRQGNARPRNHFELSRPYRAGAPEPVLLVSLKGEAPEITSRFKESQRIAMIEAPAGAGRPRQVSLYRLSGYTGQ